MSVAQLSPRQRECLRLVWDRQATSKEIAAELGISASTVNGYIAEAIETLGARDRREAAIIAFGETPRSDLGGQSARVGEGAVETAAVAPSTNAVQPWRVPWRIGGRRNGMILPQTLGWIVAIALGSICALSLAVSAGNGLRPIARPALHAFDRLTR